MPDLKNGTPVAPYFCSVCGDIYSTASDLINHLIQHSDNNTAAKRLAPVGPRKYKRRRSRPDDLPIDVGTSSSVKQEIEEELATFTFRKSVPKNLNNEEFRLPEVILSDVVDGVLPSTTAPKPTTSTTGGKKAKMIHTKKTSSDAKLKSKTTIPSKLFVVDDPMGYEMIVPDTNIKSESFPLLDDGKPLQVAPAIDYNETQNSFLLDIVNKTNYSDKFDSDIVNDLKEILQSPVKRPVPAAAAAVVEQHDTAVSSGGGRPRRSIKPTFKVVESRAAQEKESSKRTSGGGGGGGAAKGKRSDASSAIVAAFIKDEEQMSVNSCQICGESFESKAALMAHVQVHI